MGFYTITKEMQDFAFTENGSKAYKTTGSYCLDYFALIGGMRFNYQNSLNLFLKAYFENPILAIKLLFFTRDVREGLGERRIFRYTLNALANMYPEVATQLLPFISEYGRYDDLLSCYNSPIRKTVVTLIKEQLQKDIESKKNNQPISLLAKWLPSINTSSPETRELANRLSQSLGMTKEEYRKTLSFLRKNLIIENNLREKDYTFDYQTIPGGAMFKYKNAFIANDNERYQEYLHQVDCGHAKINVKTVYPYQVIRALERSEYKKISDEEKASLNTIWNSFDKTSISSKTIVVRDGSGSMYDCEAVSANSVATSLALLFAERLTGEFKNKFITFSSRPRIIEVKGNDIYEKYKFISKYDDISSTNIEAVYNLIFKVYQNDNFKKEDALDRIVIISDMEFNPSFDIKKTTYEKFKEEFEKAGFELPEVVFWNVRARNVHLPVKQEEHVKLVSGASQNIIDMVVNNENVTPYELMLKAIEKYSCFDNIII